MSAGLLPLINKPNSENHNLAAQDLLSQPTHSEQGKDLDSMQFAASTHTEFNSSELPSSHFMDILLNSQREQTHSSVPDPSFTNQLILSNSKPPTVSAEDIDSLDGFRSTIDSLLKKRMQPPIYQERLKDRQRNQEGSSDFLYGVRDSVLEHEANENRKNEKKSTRSRSDSPITSGISASPACSVNSAKQITTADLSNEPLNPAPSLPAILVSKLQDRPPSPAPSFGLQTNGSSIEYTKKKQRGNKNGGAIEVRI